MVTRKANRNERGSYTIEAALALTSFMFAFIAIVSCATIAKVESTTQYAIDQIAKEISQYYYIAERLKIANTDKGGSQEVDDMIQSIVDFGNKSSDVASKYSGTTSKDFSKIIDDFGTIKEDVNEVTKAAGKVYSSLGTVMTDKKNIVSTLATAVLKEVGNEALSRVVAQSICKALMPQYITSDGDANESLIKMGIIDGLDGLHFEMSSFLRDQRSINVVLFYRIKVNGFGIYDRILDVKQTASTAAWVTGTKLKEVASSESKWENEKFDRGKEFVEEVKNETPGKAVKGGVGIDLYDQKSNSFTTVHSLNVYMSTYSNYNPSSKNAENSGNYSLNEAAIKSAVKNYATTLKKNFSKIDGSITMDDGTQCQIPKEKAQNRNGVVKLVVPVEARSNPEHLAIINTIASEVQQETGVKVEVTYRENALS